MSLAAKTPKPKTCKNPACGVKFTPMQMGQKVCGWKCGLAIKDVNQERARKALAQVEKQAYRDAKEEVKTKGQYMREAQVAFNAWVRERDLSLPCISCGRHHQGKYDAGHYRTVKSNPAIRFEPVNCHKQCVPCNQHLSGNIVNYRIELRKRIGQDMLDWLEGPHEPKRYTIEDLKQITAEYRLKLRQLKATI